MGRDILLLLPEVPAAVGTGGQVRAYHFVRASLKVADVTACILVDADQGSMPDELHSRLKQVVQPQRIAQFDRHGTVGRVLNSLFGFATHHGRSLMLAGQGICVARSEAAAAAGNRLSPFHRIYGWLLYCQASLLRRVLAIYPSDIHVRGRQWDQINRQLQSEPEIQPDVIWCEHSYLFPLAHDLKQRYPAARIVVNCHNIEWLLKESIAQTMQTSSAHKWMQMESALMKSWETQMVKESDLLFPCSDSDAARLKTLTTTDTDSIRPIPNGVDTDYFGKSKQPPAGDATLLFMGTAGYAPNDDAAGWLVDEIFAKIRQRVPGCKLVLAGRNASTYWSHLANEKDGIRIESDVPDMRPLLAEAWISVVPLRSGSGTRLKIVEAFSALRPVVSTSVGAEGLDVEPDKHLLIRDDAGSFAEGVVQLIENPELRCSLSTAGRAVACEEYGWNELVDAAASAFADAFDGKPAEATAT